MGLPSRTELNPGLGALNVPQTGHFINSPPNAFESAEAAEPEGELAGRAAVVEEAASSWNNCATPFITTPKMARTREITNTLTRM